MPAHPPLRAVIAPTLVLAALAAAAQAPSPGPAPAPAPAAPPAAAAPPEGAASAPIQRIEITGGRGTDTEARRRSTATKIVVGREEIDKFGDSTVGEVLRRLPGVSTPGAPGRGGPPRMRGLGGGFTQILLDGQRMPPGFSLDSITPDQIERIEILRAPTAETGARAIAGTINIITREGFRVRLNELRIGTGVENGRLRGGLNWSHNNNADNLTYTLGASLFRFRGSDESNGETQVTRVDDGTLLEQRRSRVDSLNDGFGSNLNARLQWRLGTSGDSLVLMPSVFHRENDSESRVTLEQLLRRPETPPLYDRAETDSESRFTVGRLGTQWRQRLGDVRVELNSNLSAFRSDNGSLRTEFGGAGQPDAVQTWDDRTVARERSANITLKGSLLAGGQERPGSAAPTPEHSLVFGGEFEQVSRDETRTSVPDVTDFGDNLSARTRRLAAYVQDEWNPLPNWGANFGLRWEGINTRGDTGQGEQPENRTSVWTPLLNMVYRPDPKSRDQVRLSLTRSYRSPGTGALIARPSINRQFPVLPTDQPNTEFFADSAGNPDLRPELATGLDLAVERYLEGGGVISANLFHRRISNLIRSRTELEAVPWSSFERWVRRSRNIGKARTTGLELDTKFRLDQLVADAPRVELRANAAFYRSAVDGIPGPDNRLDEQATATVNLGADYRLRGLPLTLGGNINWVPGYDTQLDLDRRRSVNTRRVWDMFALWNFSPTVGLRLLGSNLAPRDTITIDSDETLVAGVAERSTSLSTRPSYANWQLRLELKL